MRIAQADKDRGRKDYPHLMGALVRGVDSEVVQVDLNWHEDFIVYSRHTTEYEMVTIPIPPGLIICRKRKTQLSWQEDSF